MRMMNDDRANLIPCQSLQSSHRSPSEHRTANQDTPERLKEARLDRLTAHRRAQDAFADVLAEVTSAELGNPTPCPAWTVLDLLEHVIGGNYRVAERAGRPKQAPLRPEGLAEAHEHSAAIAHETFASPGAMTAVFELPIGPVPGKSFIRMRTTDLLAHAWDLAVATGQPTNLDPELAAEMLADARQHLGPELPGPGKPFGEEQPCATDRLPADQLAAFLGRAVSPCGAARRARGSAVLATSAGEILAWTGVDRASQGDRTSACV
jgi:uncharacterized protein (TIGR03086 family)